MKEPLLGWRSWYVDTEINLWGFHNTLWTETALKATCQVRTHDMAPVKNCPCGIYAYNTSNMNILNTRDRWSGLRGYLYCSWFALKSIYRALEVLFTMGLAPAIKNAKGSFVVLSIFLQAPSTIPILGVVALRGKIYVYNEGARAEWAKIVCLIAPKSYSASTIRDLKTKYNVPIFKNKKEAQSYAREMGRFNWNKNQ